MPKNMLTNKEIEQSKTEFLSIASHQLRTPLATIKWYSGMLLKDKEEKLSPKQTKQIEYVHQASTRMAALISALLNVSRIELNQVNVEVSQFDLKALCQKVVKEFNSEVKSKKHIVKEVYSASLPMITSDPKLISIVLSNLFSNAVHYTPEGGTISLSVSKVKGGVLICVEDTGYGIPEQDRSKIFTKLFRGRNVKKKVQEGTGVGLYITKSIVEKICHGKVWFESETNKGSRFYVQLPLKIKPIKAVR